MVKGEIAGFQWFNVTWGRFLALLVHTVREVVTQVLRYLFNCPPVNSNRPVHIGYLWC